MRTEKKKKKYDLNDVDVIAQDFLLFEKNIYYDFYK